jgi:hypothetical protein
MGAARFSLIARRLRWSAVAAAALLACAAPDDGAEGAGGAASTGTCEAYRTAFIAGEAGFADMRKQCAKEVADYTASQPQNFDWFKNSPLGLSGPPLGILLAIMDDTEIWPRTPDQMNTLGLGTNPEPEDRSHPRMGLPYGLVYEKNPETHLRHVFFSCAGCHTGRVINNNKIELVHGAPNTEVDAQMFGWRLRDSMLGRPGKPGFAVVETDASGAYVFDEDGFPKFTLTDSGKKLRSRAIEKTRNLPGVFKGDTTESVIYELKWDEIMKKLVAGAVKTDTLYGALPQKAGSYPGDARSPKNVGPRPGMMDAYGFASGLVYTHAARDDYFAKIKARYGADYQRHPFFEGLVTPGQSDADLFAKARERIRNNPTDWLAPEPAPVDVKSLFFLADRPNVGWDGNQATSARVIASGTSSVGDPWNVNLPIHEGMGDFIGGLPPSPYPFAVNDTLARAGAPIFKANCAGCHKKNNDTVYALAAIGTDKNRANIVSPIARAGLIELMRQACDGTGNGVDVEKNISIDDYRSADGKPYSNDWCTPKGTKGETLTLRQQDDALFRERAVRGNASVGYKADDLRGIWIQAPYLHNGSVPTLWHLLNPSERPKTFVRGNINYDQEKVGFAWTERDSAPTNYEGAHVVTFDASLRGQSNAGHTFGQDLSKEDKLKLLEYLKTL